MEVALPIDFEEVAEFCALLRRTDPACLPNHLREAVTRIADDAVEVYLDGHGVTAALKPEARALQPSDPPPG